MDQGISAGRWGEHERSAFLALRGQLTEQQDRELYKRLAIAINSQQLRITTNGPPF
ncbi:hypothetical protein KRR26_32580 [Corallococcus sp. M34]|uniref:hypothetical protein n=1 Tax=Citreicoccus inhibens TaxID=2849499 RepID=UPI001C21C8D9|nr:hypothetical protein [Citreicoccus inhibens]MBU8900355.1 hypothetical protein [Citreicoccus inhibens]